MVKRIMAINTQCDDCKEELYWDIEVDSEHENWYCPKCDNNYLVPIEINRFFQYKEKQ